MFQSYSNKQLDNIAHENYEVLRSYCGILEKEGYWDGPGAILKQSIYAMLDMYVQTILIRLSVYCGKLGRDEIRFISELPDINIYDLNPDSEVEDRILHQTEKLIKSPPILLQLCGLRDNNRQTGLMGLFFDALLNIQLSMAFQDPVKTGFIAGFIRGYFSKIEAFLGNSESCGSIINERYIFKKLCSDDLDKSAHQLKMSGESFETYKELTNMKVIGSTFKHSASNSPGREAVSVRKLVAPEESKSDSIDNASDLENLLNELDGLVGLDSVKEEVRSLINLIKVRALRKKHGLPLMDMSYHMVFTGNPGTGKTTVARLIAGIYKELGILSEGNLVETDRSGLVAGYVGQTAIKVREVVEKAIGGVLFIDEAYSLASSCSNDFGDEAIETLVKLMEDHRDDLVVIVAGYTDEMQQFLKSNTGLMSRFNKFIVFEDYSDSELIEILGNMVDKAGFSIDNEALNKASEIVCSMSDSERSAFGNARGIRNMFERIVVNQANRISSLSEPDIEQLMKITVDDVRK